LSGMAEFWRQTMSLASKFSKAARHLLVHLVRILKPPGDPRLVQWQDRLKQMKRCHAADELVRDFGQPDHRVPQGNLEIWHYPLGVIGGFLYSIHAVTGRVN
jgi:hypothetical protein